MVMKFVNEKELEAAGDYLEFLYNKYRLACDEYGDYGKGYAEGRLDGAIEVMLYLGLITRDERKECARRFVKEYESNGDRS